ncbi:hypothetical protein NDU88_003699 [Pleurodeles waltl]|uniref:Uncharacterized protein n=1 Tax=Pleurodeles waltl TaxID=8319 RepID=A0AAV7VEY1_PLEWA|nr:hypothetical protein NDU88_003699 [Pleurodeles waltl]
MAGVLLWMRAGWQPECTRRGANVWRSGTVIHANPFSAHAEHQANVDLPGEKRSRPCWSFDKSLLVDKGWVQILKTSVWLGGRQLISSPVGTGKKNTGYNKGMLLATNTSFLIQVIDYYSQNNKPAAIIMLTQRKPLI